MEVIAIDIAGPYQESLGRLRYVIMFVDSASRLQRPYGTRDTSAPAILAVAKRFVVEMVVPGAIRTHNGPEYTNRTFSKYCDGLGIRPRVDCAKHVAVERPGGKCPSENYKSWAGSTGGGQQDLPRRTYREGEGREGSS